MDVDLHPLRDETVNAILMHRDIHFGGKFSFMIEYYEGNGKGVQPHFSLSLLRELENIERQLKDNLAATLLSGAEAEAVERFLKMYQKLRDLYEEEGEESRRAQLIADLILSEEELPEEEIAAIVSEGSAVVPALIELLRNEELYSPLSPGYGEAPSHAVACLEKIGDKRALISLFEMIGRSDLFEEEAALKALKAIGAPAKEFLLKIVTSSPITEDNERAAIALINFKEDGDVAALCLQQLSDPTVRKSVPLSTYLALACEGLKGEEERNRFKMLLEDPDTPSILKTDIKQIAKSWA